MAGHSRPARHRLTLIVTAALCVPGGLLAPTAALGAPGDGPDARPGQVGQASQAGQAGTEQSGQAERAGQAGQVTDAAGHTSAGSVAAPQERTPIVKKVRGGVTAVVDTGEDVLLNVRMLPTTAARRTATLVPGTPITIVCQAPGKKIKGTVRTTDLWDRLPTGGYVSDAFVTHSKAPTRCPVPRPVVPEPSPDPTGSIGSADEALAVDPAAPTDPAAVEDKAARNVVVAPKVSAEVRISAAGWTTPIPGTVGSGFREAGRPGHDGVDISVPKGTPIRSTAAGRVITVVCNASTGNCDVDGSLSVGGCGWYVEVAHAAGVVTRYCHLVRKPPVKVGQRVKAGQVIGYSGSSGNSSGPHLHFEIHTNGAPATSGNAVNPVSFLRAKGVVFRATR